VTLVESSPHLLAAFPQRVAVAARERLERLGITIVTGARVVAADAEGLRLADGTQIGADLRVWAAGVKGSDAPASLGGLEVTRNNQLVVGPTLQTTRDPRILAVGDCSSLALGREAKPLPPTAQVAHQQGRPPDPSSTDLGEGERSAALRLSRLRLTCLAWRIRRLWFARKIRPVQGRIHPGARGRTGPCSTLPQLSIATSWLLAWRSDLARGHDQFLRSPQVPIRS
jgi:Pyridine nucleotide-disulphide oxidoreductase